MISQEDFTVTIYKMISLLCETLKKKIIELQISHRIREGVGYVKTQLGTPLALHSARTNPPNFSPDIGRTTFILQPSLMQHL